MQEEDYKELIDFLNESDEESEEIMAYMMNEYMSIGANGDIIGDGE